MNEKIPIVRLAILLGVTFILACNQPETVLTTVVVTEVVEEEETPQVVTRVVEQRATVTPSTPQVVVEPPKILDISIFGSELPPLDPQLAQSDAAVDLVENLYVGLTRMNAQSQQIEPYLAQDWEVSDGGRVWTFNLRDDLFWIRPLRAEEDGSWTVEQIAPVDADDVVFTMQRACQRETNVPDVVTLFVIQGCEALYNNPDPTEADLLQIGVVALDQRTVQFRLNQPASYFLTMSALWYFRPISKVVVEEFPDAWLDEENFVTSGPFFPIPERRRLQLQPDWPLPMSGNIDFVNYTFVSDLETAVSLWRDKSIDYIPAVGDGIDQTEEAFQNRVQIEPEQTLFYLGFNFDSGVFREPEVRRAFSAAIDRELLIEEAYGGSAFPMTHLVPSGIVGAAPLTEVGMGYDPDYARIQMGESGFGSCRLMPPIRFLVNSSDLSLRQAELLREMWIEELGCAEEQIIIEQAQFGTLLANTRKDAGAARPDLWELGWASFYPDAHSWHGELMHCAESENRPNRPCMEVDQMIQQAATELDNAARLELYRQIESDLFSRDGIAPIAPLYATGETYLVQAWLQFPAENFGGHQYDRFVLDETLKRLERSRGGS